MTELSRFLLLLCMPFRYRPDKNNRRKVAASLWKKKIAQFISTQSRKSETNLIFPPVLLSQNSAIYVFLESADILQIRRSFVFASYQFFFNVLHYFCPLTWRIYVPLFFRFQGVYLFSYLRILRCGHSSSDPCHITYTQ